MRQILFAASALTICATSAAANRVPVTHISGTVQRVASAMPGAVTLYNQNGDDTGVAVISTHFTDIFDSYSSYGADDFTVPAGHKWKVREVEVTGAYVNGSGPPESENVVFFKDKRGLPGNPVAECDNLNGTDNQGSFAIKLPKSCKVGLAGGRRYWVSVSANMDFSCCGQWDWETRNTQNGDPAAWENPNGGFGICPTWEILTSCIQDEGPDFMFALKGKDEIGTPVPAN